MNKKEFLIKNPARAVRAQMVQEPYVPEWQRLMAEGKLKGIEAATDLPEHQATLRNQVIKELQLSPKVTVPSVGQQDIGWNKQTKFYDEPLLERPVYDDNFIREDLTSEELEILYEEAAKKQINLENSNPSKNKDNFSESAQKSKEYEPPTSLDQLSSNEIVIIAENQVLFSSTDEESIKAKLADLIFQNNLNPDKILVIKRLPISISINIS
jgi:hypothetical protein